MVLIVYLLGQMVKFIKVNLSMDIWKVKESSKWEKIKEKDNLKEPLKKG